MTELLSDEFRSFSARIGRNPLMIQGPGGNTSIKDDTIMWIKASGMELAYAETGEVFVAVNRQAAREEAFGKGDGTCKSTLIDTTSTLRPSIETTFHAGLNAAVVAHSHSVNVISHMISVAGQKIAAEKLAGIEPLFVPYAKPGLPLTREILQRVNDNTRVILLENHGLICCGETVEETAATMKHVEELLALKPIKPTVLPIDIPPQDGYVWAQEESWMALNDRVCSLIQSGSYYPDHVVFLGSGIRRKDTNEASPVFLEPDVGIQIKAESTLAQHAMLRCLSDVMCRIPQDWVPIVIGVEAEAELLDWDAEKYRQALADRS